MGALLRAAAVRQRPCVVPHRGWVCARAATCGAHSGLHPCPTHTHAQRGHAGTCQMAQRARTSTGWLRSPRKAATDCVDGTQPRSAQAHTPHPHPHPHRPQTSHPAHHATWHCPRPCPSSMKLQSDCWIVATLWAATAECLAPDVPWPLRLPAAVSNGLGGVLDGRAPRKPRAAHGTQPSTAALHPHMCEYRPRASTHAHNAQGRRAVEGVQRPHQGSPEGRAHTPLHTLASSGPAGRDSCSGAPPTRSTSHTHDNAGEAEAQAGKK